MLPGGGGGGMLARKERNKKKRRPSGSYNPLPGKKKIKRCGEGGVQGQAQVSPRPSVRFGPQRLAEHVAWCSSAQLVEVGLCALGPSAWRSTSHGVAVRNLWRLGGGAWASFGVPARKLIPVWASSAILCPNWGFGFGVGQQRHNLFKLRIRFAVWASSAILCSNWEVGFGSGCKLECVVQQLSRFLVWKASASMCPNWESISVWAAGVTMCSNWAFCFSLERQRDSVLQLGNRFRSGLQAPMCGSTTQSFSRLEGQRQSVLQLGSRFRFGMPVPFCVPTGKSVSVEGGRRCAAAHVVCAIIGSAFRSGIWPRFRGGEVA